MAPAQMGKQEALKRFATDLTARARKGEMDPISGRDEEIRQIVDILMRRRQNNPILTGEAGVGKTAVVEGFAQRLASGDVPPPLQDVSLYSLDIGLLQAGASMKGEFENRLRQVIDEVQASPKPIILFVDEAHTLIGAGGSAGTGDAANLLKPALARGTLRTIAATTWAEYKKYIEKDPALTRRFQVVQVVEPTEDKAILMVRGVASVLEKHHRVQVLDEALEAAVRLSHRYIPARQLPDKAVSLLDTSCARVAISHHGVPPQLEDCRRTLEALRTELEIIGREEAVGVNAGGARAAAEEKLAAGESERDAARSPVAGRKRASSIGSWRSGHGCVAAPNRSKAPAPRWSRRRRRSVRRQRVWRSRSPRRCLPPSSAKRCWRSWPDSRRRCPRCKGDSPSHSAQR
jgi:type VI secretion system protein VasG